MKNITRVVIAIMLMTISSCSLKNEVNKKENGGGANSETEKLNY